MSILEAYFLRENLGHKGLCEKEICNRDGGRREENVQRVLDIHIKIWQYIFRW